MKFASSIQYPNHPMSSPFHFKQFSISHHRCAHKVGTDGVLLGAWAEHKNPQKILDVGTGSALIALMLAQRFPEADISGIELDADSAEQAKENATSSPFAERVKILQEDFLKHSFEEKFDLIVSNPPFFKGVYSSGNERRDRARHEFSLPQKDFIEKAVQLLTPHGKLEVILSVEEGKHFIQNAEDHRLHLNHITKVKGTPTSSVNRYLMAFELKKSATTEKLFTLRDHTAEYSRAYRDLTADFHP